MYIRKSTRKHKGKTYTNYLLVESVQTPKGPRQRVICSLGNLAPAPREEWLVLAHKLEASLRGQLSLGASQDEIDNIVAEVRRTKKRTHFADPGSIIEVDSDRVDVEQAREAGPVHVGHQIWRQLKLDDILRQGVHASWWTLRQELSTHQVVTVVLPTTDGRVLRIRKATVPAPAHREIYATLGIPIEIMNPEKTWHRGAAGPPE